MSKHLAFQTHIKYDLMEHYCIHFHTVTVFEQVVNNLSYVNFNSVIDITTIYWVIGILKRKNKLLFRYLAIEIVSILKATIDIILFAECYS